MSPPDTPENTPPADDEKVTQSHAGGFTLDLSSSKPSSKAPADWRRKRKQADPFTTKVFDLTQPSEPVPPPKPKPAKAKPKAKKSDSKRSGTPKRASGGSALADLLDPETLARLRGDS